MKTRLAVLAIVIATQASSAPSLFRGPRTVATIDTRGVASGDFNGDGQLDLLTGGFDRVAVHLNSAGTLGPAIETVTGQNRSGWTAGDLNDDGDADLVAGTSSGVERWLSNGDGTFTSNGNLITSNFTLPWLNAIADFSGDGVPDVISVAAGTGGSALFLAGGNGDGTFQTPVRSDFGGTNPGRAIKTGDIDNDGRLDVAVAAGDAVYLLHQTSGGSFSVARTFSLSGRAVELADVDEDGWLDVLEADAEEFRTWLQTSPGVFHQSFFFWVVSSVVDLETAYLDGDDDLDVIGTRDDGRFIVALNRGGVDGPDLRQHYGTVPDFAIAADWNGDGETDLASAGGQTASVIRGNGDGTFATYDTFALPATQGDFSLSDVTSDGIEDLVGIFFYRPIANEPWNAVVSVRAGLGDGTYSDARIQTSVARQNEAKLADFNGDGASDVLFTSGEQTATSSVYLANADGTYGLAMGGLSPDCSGCIAGDFTGDGNDDLLRITAGALQLLPSNGNGTFGAPVSTSDGSTFVNHHVAGLINGDNRLDVVGNGKIWFGNADGTFTAGPPFTVSPNIIGALSGFADLDGDGSSDAFGKTSSGVQIHPGNGDGTFDPVVHFRCDCGFSNFSPLTSAGDIDGDGFNDLLIGSAVLLSDGTGRFDGYAYAPFVPDSELVQTGDVDGNGSLDILSLRGGMVDVLLTKTTTALDLPIGIELTNTPNPAPYGSSTHLSAELDPSATDRPLGAVVFRLDDAPIGIDELHYDVAPDEASTSWLIPLGAHNVSAQYTGDPVYAPSAQSSKSQTINRGVIELSITGAPNPGPFNEPIELEVTVGGSATATSPSGSIVIRDGNTVLHTITPFASNWTYRVDVFLAPGTHTITAEYAGDANFDGDSASYQQVVTKGTSAITLAATPDHHPQYAGTPITLTATFDASSDDATGTVSFVESGHTLGTAPIVGGVATFQTTFTPAMQHSVVAVYGGDDQYDGTTSNAIVTSTYGPVRQGTLFWHHTGGSAYAWDVDGLAVLGQRNVSSPGTGWRLAAVHDFDLDNDRDVVWQSDSGVNQIWYLQNGAAVQKQTIASAGDVNWRIVGAADFDRDGHPDLLWQHAVTGQLYLWYMSRGTLLGGANVNNVGSPDWQVGAILDFEGRDWVRILWRHRATGQNYLWFMRNNQLVDQMNVTPVADTNWRIAAAQYSTWGHWIYWQHATTGQLYYWRMPLNIPAESGNFNSVAGSGWRLMGPR